jgi:hypothetical protein
MRSEIKYAVYLICLGFALVAYAHQTFATKEYVHLIHEDVKEVKQDVKELLKR